MKILVLDDHHEDISPLFAGYLPAAEIRYARTPAQALCELETRRFDVLLLDGDLGQWKGPDVLRSWKQRGLSVPTVVMFSSDPSLNAKGIEAGASFAIDKGNCSDRDFYLLAMIAEGDPANTA